MECGRTPQGNLEIRVDRLIADEAMWWNWSEEFKRLHAADISNATSDDVYILADSLKEFLEEKLREMFGIYLRTDDSELLEGEVISSIISDNGNIKTWMSELSNHLIEDFDTLMLMNLCRKSIKNLRRLVLGAVLAIVSMNYCTSNEPEGEVHNRVIEAGSLEKE